MRLEMCLAAELNFPNAFQLAIELGAAHFKFRALTLIDQLDITPLFSAEPQVAKSEVKLIRTQMILFASKQVFSMNPRCAGTEDITFQFGVLSDEQRAFLVDPTEFVGIAVRTDYDEVNLRGKGFIYISADQGSLRYRGEQLRGRAWHEGKGGFLYRAIVHELGHVFGLRHGGSGLMSESYSESLLKTRFGLSGSGDSLDLPRFFVFDASADRQAFSSSSLTNDNERSALFGSEFSTLLHLTLQRSGQSFSIVATSYAAPFPQRLGTITGTIENIPSGNLYGIEVVLTEKQTVFHPDANRYVRLRGPSAAGKRLIGKFTPVDPNQKPFDSVLSLFPESAIWDGMIDGKYRSNIFSWTYGSVGY